jgi:protein-S-isoprenylcysteine O-methyltransferase Ste14
VAACSLGLEVVYLAVCLVLPLAVSRARAGTWALRLTPGAGAAVGALFVVANVAQAVPPVLAVLGVLPRIGALDHLGVHVAGVALGVGALGSIVWAQRAMRSSWRIGVDPLERTALVTGGPFRLVRNPIYLGAVAMALAVAMLIPNPTSLAVVALFVVAVQAQVRAVEEPLLARLHGGQYAAWAARVGRFVPGVGRIR